MKPPRSVFCDQAGFSTRRVASWWQLGAVRQNRGHSTGLVTCSGALAPGQEPQSGSRSRAADWWGVFWGFRSALVLGVPPFLPPTPVFCGGRFWSDVFRSRGLLTFAIPRRPRRLVERPRVAKGGRAPLFFFREFTD
ncbi:hypothetical protein AGDE_15598 [Angomonas deanei]|uniref:Uncharacterized protein n=1 Tax=Angomonas deanei TaxID=59799 RepID=A0A7G2C2H0_9TRYP|nr:hypothetical protein AGDE_15598 [Angomonas deanei]CAD2212897.1 hypothetical protein, conserved [Angomonas deanei]|eukprot:EPY18787.1 hypothetical protein AGDE_15598 [Angomonas deanei]